MNGLLFAAALITGAACFVTLGAARDPDAKFVSLIIGLVCLVGAGVFASMLFCGKPGDPDRNYGLFSSETVYQVWGKVPAGNNQAYFVKPADSPESVPLYYLSSAALPDCFMYTPDATHRFTSSDACPKIKN